MKPVAPVVQGGEERDVMDDVQRQENAPPAGLPLHVRAIIRPWWKRPGEGDTVEFEGRRCTVEELVVAAERAVEMAERLSGDAAWPPRRGRPFPAPLWTAAADRPVRT